LRKVIDLAFIEQEFNGQKIKIFNPRLFGGDFSFFRDKNNQEVLGATTPNFFIYCLPPPSYFNIPVDIQLLNFIIYCKDNLNSPVGFVHFEIFHNKPYINLHFNLAEQLFYDELALEIFTHLIVVLLHSLGANGYNKVLFCEVDKHIKTNPDDFFSSQYLMDYVRQMFDFLLFEKKYGEDKTISGVSMKTFQKIIHNNKIILQNKAALANSSLPKAAVTMESPEGRILADITPNRIDRPNINNAVILSPANCRVEKKPFTKKLHIT